MIAEDQIVVVLRGKVYASVKQASDLYGMNVHAVYKTIKKMEESKRYGRFLKINQNHKMLVNLLMLEDWLSVCHLYEAGLEKHAPAVDLAAVRRARGE